jgi:hypothetical protein
MSAGAHQRTTQVLRLKNSCNRDLTLYVEPWGDELVMQANEVYDILAQGPVGDTIEIEYSENYWVLYGWPGSVLSISRQGTSVRDYAIPAPTTPSKQG